MSDQKASFRSSTSPGWITRSLFLLLTLFALGLGPVAAQYTWKNVNISGAGAMVTDVYAHPLQNGLVYIRTDVGGSYRWNAASSKWVALNDSLTFTQNDAYCCEGFAIDPQNVNVVYYAGGKTAYGRNGLMFKSTNQGASWSQLLNSPPVLMNGNGDLRWSDCRLLVSPFDSGVVLFGSRYNGLWLSQNGGANWTNIAVVPGGGAINYNVQSIAFDPVTSGRVYAFVSGGAHYVSNDNGMTWTSIGGSNSRRIKVAPNGTLWCTTLTGVSKYTAGTWTNYTPGTSANIFGALGINPANSNEILVCKGQSSPYSIWRTTNGGTTWTQQTYTVSSTAAWSTPGFNNYRPNDFVYDPFNTSRVWGDRWLTTNINAATVAWVQQEAGHEEDVAGAIIAPPTGFEMLNGVFDDDGFAMDNGLDTYPSQKLDTTTGYNGHTWSMAYCESDTSTMIRLGYQSFYGGTISPVIKSTNGGIDWVRQTTFPANLFPLDCAISATNNQTYVVICNANYSTNPGNWTSLVAATSPWRRTTDGGLNWSIISGLPTPPSFYGPWGINQFLAADHVNGSKFYYLDIDTATNKTTGKIYRSVNSGGTFAQCNPSSLIPAAKAWFQLKSMPGTEGSLWACVDNYPSSNRTTDEGLWRSNDSGVTWTKVSTVNRAFSFGFGKSSTSTPALYLYGRTGGGTTDALFTSADLGATWTNIMPSGNNLADYPSIIEGSRQTAGRVFLGTGGRGFFYGSAPVATGQITWGAATNITGDANVATNGTYVDAAVTNYTVNGGSPVTVNGTAFNIIASGNSNASDPSGIITLTSSRNLFSGSNSPSGGANYNMVVAKSEYGQNGSQTVTLHSLTIGHTYQVQVWSAAIGQGAYLTNLSGANTVTLNASTGQFVTGTFTANAATFSFTASNNASSVNGVHLLNAVAVRDLGP